MHIITQALNTYSTARVKPFNVAHNILCELARYNLSSFMSLCTVHTPHIEMLEHIRCFCLSLVCEALKLPGHLKHSDPFLCEKLPLASKPSPLSM